MTHYEALTLGPDVDRFVAVLSCDETDRVLWVNWALYSVANADGPPDLFICDDGFTDDFEQASVAAEGFVKWDGCHEFTVEDYHGCSPKDLGTFLGAIAAAARAAAGLLTDSEHDWSEP